jgi:hypothetical protein
MKRLVKHNQLKPLGQQRKDQIREQFEEDDELRHQVSLNTKQREAIVKEDEFVPQVASPKSEGSDASRRERKRKERLKKEADLKKEIEAQKQLATSAKGYNLSADLKL